MGLQERTIRSGAWVAAGHGAGAAVTAVSALWLSRLLGPSTFALYAFCSALVAALRVLGRLGVNAQLLARREEPEPVDYEVGLATMLVASTAVACLSVIALPGVARLVHMPTLFRPAAAMMLLLPLHVVPLPAVTRLERALLHRPVVLLDLGFQAMGQAVGIALAYRSWGIWAPITASVLRAALQGAASWALVGLWPRLRWDWRRARQMIRYGAGFVLTTGLANARAPALLGVVGRTLGQDAVGYVGLTLRAVGLVAPFRAAVSRVLVPALAPTAHVPGTIRKALNAAVETELLVSIPVIVLAVAIYRPAVALLLGPVWWPTVTLFPWVAAASLLSTAHAAPLAALQMRGYFAEYSVCTVVGCVVLAAAQLFLARVAGVEGAVAAMALAWPAAWLHEWYAGRRLGAKWSRYGVSWAVAGAATCLLGHLGLWTLVLTGAIVMATRSALRARVDALIGAVLQPFAGGRG